MKIIKEFYNINEYNGVYRAKPGSGDSEKESIKIKKEMPSAPGGYGELWNDIVSGKNPLLTKINNEFYRITKGIVPEGFTGSRDDIKKLTGLQIPPVPDGYEDLWKEIKIDDGRYPLRSIDGINWYPYYARIPGEKIIKEKKKFSVSNSEIVTNL